MGCGVPASHLSLSPALVTLSKGIKGRIKPRVPYSGSYLGEDDIVRFDDIYGRVEG